MTSSKALCVGLLCLSFAACGDDDPSAEQPVSSTTTASSCSERMIVYFDPSVSDEKVEEELASIQSIDGVVEAEFVSHEETFAEFREIFADSPQLIESVTADILPASIRVRVDEQASLDDVELHVNSLAHVHDVIRGDDVLSPAVEERMGPDQLERWCGGES